jgi:hypothetical protein
MITEFCRLIYRALFLSGDAQHEFDTLGQFTAAGMLDARGSG